jgi:hypothetical protein
VLRRTGLLSQFLLFRELKKCGEKHDTIDCPVLEQGAVTATSDGAWTYTTTTNLTPGQNVAIEVAATDCPGHNTTKVQSKD